MLPLNGKHGVVISRIPVMQNGLGSVMARHFPEFELTYCRSLQELTLLQLRRADVIIADVSGYYGNPRGLLEEYYGLLNQYRGIHWIFLVSRPLYPIAVELLMRPESTLLSDMEPIEGVINAIRAGSDRAERISQTLLLAESPGSEDEDEHFIALTHSERKVLRLLGKGWGIKEAAIKWSAAPDMTPQTVLYRRPVAQFSNFQPKIVSSWLILALFQANFLISGRSRLCPYQLVNSNQVRQGE